MPLALVHGQWEYPWRVHYHVPLFAGIIEGGSVSTTVEDMKQAYRYAQKHQLCKHYEIETYTWTVLPKNLRPADDQGLARGIAQEIKFVELLTMGGLV